MRWPWRRRRPLRTETITVTIVADTSGFEEAMRRAQEMLRRTGISMRGLRRMKHPRPRFADQVPSR